MIFILGGNGFVGSAFARLCAQRGLEFAAITRENYDAFAGQACQTLINANGNSKKFLATEAPLEEFDASVRSVRKSLLDFKFDAYVHLSTVDVYPDCSPEADTREEAPLDPAAQSTYGFHKYLAEQCVRHGAKRWLILRLGGFVGPGLWKNPIHDILTGGTLWLDLRSRLQFLHTDDAAAMAMQLIDVGCRQETINFCGDGVISLEEAASAAERVAVARPGSPHVHYEVDLGKLRKLAPPPRTRATVTRYLCEQVEAARSDACTFR